MPHFPSRSLQDADDAERNAGDDDAEDDLSENDDAGVKKKTG